MSASACSGIDEESGQMVVERAPHSETLAVLLEI